jgi:hypothetical protein
MATFDQLPAEQRAIIELVVTRGRSYDALADVLQVSASRVRELALDALVELSPVSAERVDPQWRSQIADYLLGQQSGAESTATEAHLRRSEPGRTWALSLLDSLDTLYANGDRPSIPEPDESGRGRRGDGAGPAVAVADAEQETRTRERDRKREKRDRDKEREREKEPDSEREAAAKPPADRSVLSPAAQNALRRRRRLGAAIGAVVLAAVVVGILAIAGVFGGDDNGGGNSSASNTTSTTPAAGGQPQVLGQIPLQPLNGAKAQGAAFILNQGGKPVLAVQAKLPPLPASQRKAAYNVWLYNSPKDAFSIGAQFTDAQGNYQGVKELPDNYKRYKFVDISIQPFNKKTNHSGNSVLRGAFANIQPVQQQQQGGAGTTPTTPSGP